MSQEFTWNTGTWRSMRRTLKAGEWSPWIESICLVSISGCLFSTVIAGQIGREKAVVFKALWDFIISKGVFSAALPTQPAAQTSQNYSIYANKTCFKTWHLSRSYRCPRRKWRSGTMPLALRQRRGKQLLQLRPVTITIAGRKATKV